MKHKTMLKQIDKIFKKVKTALATSKAVDERKYILKGKGNMP